MTARNLEKQRICALGLMSGTSMDGIDAALVATDGEALLERGPGASFAFEPAFRTRLAEALRTAGALQRREDRPGDLAELEREITLRHAAAVRRFLEDVGRQAADVDLIGFHGQTVLHRPDKGFTVQLGDGALLAAETGIPVAWDMRANDMAHGGQGAPLVPAYHGALARNLPSRFAALRPAVFVNIGGIANLTWVGEDGRLIAFDTGPGNALIDQWVAARTGMAYDAGGAIASAGRVAEALAARYLCSSYFLRNYPKSLDRNDFTVPSFDEAGLEDGARTLAHVTAVSIARAFDLLPIRPRLAVLCGGGRRNAAIVSELRAAVAGTLVVLAEEVELDGDATEAEAWAYLAARAARGLPLTWPETTGAREPATGGRISYPDSGTP